MLRQPEGPGPAAGDALCKCCCVSLGRSQRLERVRCSSFEPAGGEASLRGLLRGRGGDYATGEAAQIVLWRLLAERYPDPPQVVCHGGKFTNAFAISFSPPA